MKKWPTEMDSGRGDPGGGRSHLPWSKPQSGVKVGEVESVSLRKVARAALGSKEPRSSETLSSQSIEHRVAWGCLCHGSARLPGVVLGSEKYSPHLRPGSLQPGPRNQTTPPSLPGIPRHDQDTRTPGRPHGCSRRLWLFGTWESGGTRAEGCCPGEEELGTRRPRLSRGPALIPLLPKGHARGQGRSGPASGLWCTLSLLG